jgi:hypothetical protein
MRRIRRKALLSGNELFHNGFSQQVRRKQTLGQDEVMERLRAEFRAQSLSAAWRISSSRV